MDHSYEEIRSVALDILAGHEKTIWGYDQYQSLKTGIAEVLKRREENVAENDILRWQQSHSHNDLSKMDGEIFLEVFWELFRQGIITLGLNDSNINFPFFRVSGFGKKVLEQNNTYYFHDFSGYQKVIVENIPNIDTVTLDYLKEAMQAFLSGCILASTVMIGVSIEYTFLKLLETIENNPQHEPTYKNVFNERTILPKINKFKNILDLNVKTLKPEIKEDLDTNFTGILTMIRNFRNQAGHPSGTIISREQCFVLLQLFIPCCRKIYQLIDFYKT
jgi:hypothetical protein